MNAMGNFLLGSYLTGMLFMFFHAEKMYDEYPGDDNVLPCRLASGLFWPAVALVFILQKFGKAFCVFWK